MNELSIATSVALPSPRCEVSIRAAVESDYAFIDHLQRMHSKALGFMRKAALEGKIRLGEVLVAWATRPCSFGENTGGSPVPREELIGYCIFSNRYLKRDELGVIYQMNVLPGKQRHLVGATLLKAVFDRAPYGCKLFCCWCAQDLNANYFWESLGFIPLAFRAGAQGRSARGQTRAHIFWQRRIREGDVATPYWFPSKTDGGMMREDRIVLPIPPGVKWSDEMPILLPEVAQATRPCLEHKTKITGESPVPRLRQPIAPRMQFGPPGTNVKPVIETTRERAPRPQKPKREKVKADPTQIAAARELRDRYLEQFNSGVLADGINVLPGGKYDVCRVIDAKPQAMVEPKMLAA